MVKEEGRETVKIACERAVSILHLNESGGTYLVPSHIQLNLCLTLSDALEHLFEAIHQFPFSRLACAESTLLLALRLLRLVQRLIDPPLQVTLVDILVVDLGEVWCS